MENQSMNPQQIQQQNFLQRQAVISNSLKMKQEIFSKSVNPASENVINVGSGAIRNSGLLLGFIVEIEASVTVDAVDPVNRTPYGTSTLVSEIKFDDLSNNTRIQVPGWYLSFLNTVRQGFGYGGAYQPNLPMGYGANYNVFAGGATVAAAATEELRHVYYVPISYSSTDLRGSIYMSTVAATSNLQITLNKTPVQTAGNPMECAYVGNGGDYSGNVLVKVTQVYLSQIPTDQNGNPILPYMDLSTTYDLKQTTYSGLSASQDFPMAYSNYRSFLSTTVVFDNAGVLNDGTDVNYFALRSASMTNISKVSPAIAALDARATLMSDPPSGTYLFESRDIPINTVNYGNQELIINPSSVGGSTSRMLVGYESFALTQQVANASSLGGG